MGKIVKNIVYASTQVRAEHLVFFPFGMGAFIRHLGQLDGAFLEDEMAVQRLRRRLAHTFMESLAQTDSKMRLYICLQISTDESQRNADAFLRACQIAAPALKQRITIVPEGDCLQLAHDLAFKSENVVMVNGANRTLLGNHWFDRWAKFAIDENLHRRSWRMAATSYLLNGYDGHEPGGRGPDDLQRRVEWMGGRIAKIK